MRTIFLMIVLGIQWHCSAQVTHLSLYYQKNSLQPDLASEKQLEIFREQLSGDSLSIQLIEINTFAQCDSKEASLKLSEKRLTTLLFALNSDEVFDTNVYGAYTKEVAFPVESWDRIDIYYFRTVNVKLSGSLAGIADQPKTPSVTVSHPDIENIAPEDSKSLQEYRLNVKFYGSSVKMKPGYETELTQMKAILLQDTAVCAEIRGHVCCGNKRILSRKRAKEVYSYLIESGVKKERLSFKGFGNTAPLVSPERGPGDRALNRRVEIVFDRAVSASGVMPENKNSELATSD